MKAVATDGRSGLEVVEVPRPQPLPDGGLVRVLACGLCGSDLEKILAPAARAGQVLGHEVVGILERTHEPPTRVALAHHVPCGSCSLCNAGHSSLCEQFATTGLVPGGFAETLAVGPLHLANAVFPLPAEVDDLAGTLLEPLSCVLRALDTADSLLTAYPAPRVQRRAAAAPFGPQGPVRLAGNVPAQADGAPEPQTQESAPPAHVLVAGCGAVGLLFLSVLGAGWWPYPRADDPAGHVQRGSFQPESLFFLEPDAQRAALAQALGARVLSETRPEEAKVQLALVTAPAALPQVVAAMAPGGVVVVFAADSRQPALDLDSLYRREITIAGVRSGSPAHLRAALQILTAGVLDLRWLQPLVVSLSELPWALERYARGEVLKVVARP